MDDKEVRERILEGAEGLFMKYGIRSVSMDDIARQLGISKKTLYQHFADKDDMIQQVSLSHLSRNQQEMEDMRRQAVNAIDELALISVALRKGMEELNPSLLFDLKKYHPKAWSAWQEHKQRIVRESVARNLRQGIAEGFYRQEINPEVLSVIRLEIVELIFDEQIFPHDKYVLTKVQMEVFDHFVYGLLTDKGRALYEEYKSKVKSQEMINQL
ncbi:MAG: TetR/AcrR family transcriptional regulator [Cyclobacteriaceae bacterium]|nr:TetR/AcrR family transcriptional regulator [Cyclobacteriaceae bacterium]